MCSYTLGESETRCAAPSNDTQIVLAAEATAHDFSSIPSLLPARDDALSQRVAQLESDMIKVHVKIFDTLVGLVQMLVPADSTAGLRCGRDANTDQQSLNTCFDSCLQNELCQLYVQVQNMLLLHSECLEQIGTSPLRPAMHNMATPSNH